MKLLPIVLAILCAAENIEKKAARQERNRLEREQKRNEQKKLRELARKEAKKAEKERISQDLIQARGIPVDDSFGIAVESDIPGTTRETRVRNRKRNSKFPNRNSGNGIGKK